VKLWLAAIGKTKTPFVADGLAHYEKRLVRYLPYERLELPDVKGPLPEAEQKRREAERLLAALPHGATLVALDGKGKSLATEAFAAWLQGRMNAGTAHIVFAVGGAYGHGEDVLRRAELALSLSPLTFPHDLVRLIFAEQLYRILTILKGEPYHHG